MKEEKNPKKKVEEEKYIRQPAIRSNHARRSSKKT